MTLNQYLRLLIQHVLQSVINVTVNNDPQDPSQWTVMKRFVGLAHAEYDFSSYPAWIIETPYMILPSTNLTLILLLSPLG